MHKILSTLAQNTYSGFGGSLANSVPSFRPRSLISSGSESVSELSIGSNGFIGKWLFEFVAELPTVDDGLPPDADATDDGLTIADDDDDEFDDACRLRGGASGCGCDC